MIVNCHSTINRQINTFASCINRKLLFHCLRSYQKPLFKGPTFAVLSVIRVDASVFRGFFSDVQITNIFGICWSVFSFSIIPRYLLDFLKKLKQKIIKTPTPPKKINICRDSISNKACSLRTITICSSIKTNTAAVWKICSASDPDSLLTNILSLATPL